MSYKDTAFYRRNKEVLVDFSGEEISSDGSIVFLEKLEREYKIIKHFSGFIPDDCGSNRITHSTEKLLKQRVFMQMLGYEDTNDVGHLKKDPLFQDVLDGDLASQPTLSRFENRLTKQAIFDLGYAWIDWYVSSLAGRDEIIIDIDATDDPTHGSQQLTLFNGFLWSIHVQ